MPLYEYECGECGVFTAFKKLSEYRETALCDECGCVGMRIISMPQLAILSKGQRTAHERNEKSAHEPGVRRRSSCGCTGSHTCKTGNSESSQDKPASTKYQMQTKKTARPWMLGH